MSMFQDMDRLDLLQLINDKCREITLLKIKNDDLLYTIKCMKNKKKENKKCPN